MEGGGKGWIIDTWKVFSGKSSVHHLFVIPLIAYITHHADSNNNAWYVSLICYVANWLHMVLLYLCKYIFIINKSLIYLRLMNVE